MAAPTVSVVMTAYNRERYIGSAIESVLASSFADFELIVVDDHSTDGTIEIAHLLARRDPRIRVIVNERNLGDYPNRNRAAQVVRGQFFKYHDSDDLMYPYCLETMVSLLAHEPRAGFGLSHSRAWLGGPCPMLLTPRMCYQREFLGSGLFSGGPANALFRTETFRALGGFPERGLHSDALFWLSACRTTNVLLIPADLFWYRIHPGQERFRSTTAEHEAAVMQGEFWRALHSPDCPLEGEELEQARRNWMYFLFKVAILDARAGRWSVIRERFRSGGVSWAQVASYLRPPKRNLFLGTPLDSHGEPAAPDWTAFTTNRVDAHG